MKNIITLIIGGAIVFLGYTWLQSSQFEGEVRNFNINKEINNIQSDQVTESTSSIMDGVYVAQKDKTELKWTGRTPVKSHYGTVDLDTGEIKIQGANISGKVVFDMKSIISEAGDALDSHLKNGDFFDTEKYPTAEIVITGYSPNNLLAELTIKGITKNINVPVLLGVQNNTIYLKGDFTIDRTEWGIKYNSKSLFSDLGDRAINDDIEFSIDLQAQKNG